MARTGGFRMKKTCDCCRRYLDHLDEKNKDMSCFLRRLTAKSKHSMIVPNRFVENFRGNLSGTIKLSSPNGSLYDVEITQRSNNKKVLRQGWETFCEAHHIEENDFLLFRHMENSIFEVLILDSDGCEKVFSCPGIKGLPGIRDRSVDCVDISSSSQHDTTESSESERSNRCQKRRSGHLEKTAKIAAASLSPEESGYTGEEEDTPSENKSCELNDPQKTPGADYVILRGSCLSEEQKEGVTAFVQEIQPESTAFVALMRKCHVQPRGPYLAISKEYAVAHFPHENKNVTLQRPGKIKKWHPLFYKRIDRSMYMLRGQQWFDFVRDNHVQEGDICILFPTKCGREFTFMVRLLRATAARSTGGTAYQRVSSCHGRSNSKMDYSAIHIKEKPTDGERVSSASGMHEVFQEYVENEEFGGPSQPPYILPAGRRGLSKSQKKIVEERVRAIQSEVPIYVAIMRKTSVDPLRYPMLELGSRYTTAMRLPARGRTVVLQHMRKIWKTKTAIRSGTRQYLNQGWPQFVHDNGLRIGDICLFELKRNERKVTMEVHIIFREHL